MAMRDAAVTGNLDEVERLLNANPKLVFSKDSINGWTPLHWAASYGRKDVGEFLLANKAEYTIHDVAAIGDLDRVKQLLDANPDLVFAKDEFGSTPLFFAAYNGQKEVVALFLANRADVNAKGDAGLTALRGAVDGDHKDIAELLLAQKAEINTKDNCGSTPLHSAAAHGHKGMVELLLANKADVNAKDITGWTPLHWETIGHQTKVAELLREHGGQQ